MSERAAGRELDAEIAERVMGWILKRTGGTGKYRSAMKWVDASGKCMYVVDWHWNPSQDITQAMLVLSAMNQPGCRVCVTFDAITVVEWERMREDASWEMIAEVEHDDFPMAVCLAALEGRAALSSSSGQGAE